MTEEIKNMIQFLVGNSEAIENITSVPALTPFSDSIVDLLSEVSREIMKDPHSHKYSDVITFAFWIRKGSVLRMKKEYERGDGRIHLGRGIAFHIAPSNVPVNFAYSLTAGLLTGNANVVRVPMKKFPQVEIICSAFRKVLEFHKELQSYCIFVRYERNKDINDVLSAICDIRIIWGGDKTIKEIRESELPPRSTEITFADRYSLAVIDSDFYVETENKRKVATDFYNDTYFSDQNACTSPRFVAWIGSKKEEAKERFWEELYQLVQKKYLFQSIQGINKLTSSYMAAVYEPGIKIERYEDNRLFRIKVSKVTNEIMSLKDNSGYFFEYNCDDVLDLRPLCDDKKCQTIGICGNQEILMPLLLSGIKGVDRVVSIGKTMDFGLVWDGIELVGQMTRVIEI